jgi:hypothetical protein
LEAGSHAIFSEDARESRRSTWIELARELAKLSLKRQLAAPGQIAPTPTFLADTISF